MPPKREVDPDRAVLGHVTGTFAEVAADRRDVRHSVVVGDASSLVEVRVTGAIALLEVGEGLSLSRCLSHRERRRISGLGVAGRGSSIHNF